MRVSRRAWGRAIKRYALFAAVWTGVLVLSWVTFVQGRYLGGTAAWAGVLHPVVFGLTAWPILRRFARGERWLTIPNAVLGLTYLSIGLGSVYFVFRYDTLGYAALRRPRVVRPALLVAMAGIVAYRVGAEVPWFRGLVRRLPELSSTPRWSWGVRAALFAVVGLAVASKLYLAATGSLGFVTVEGGMMDRGLRSILAYMSEVGLLALSGGYFYWFAGAPLKRGDRTFLVTATALLAGLGLLSGMKEEFLFVFFGVAIPYVWTYGRKAPGIPSRAKELVFALSLVGVMLVLFAINPIYRSALNEFRATEDRIDQGAAATGLVLDRVSSGTGLTRLLARGAENAWSRLSIFPYHLAVVDQVPGKHSYRGLGHYFLLPAISAIPRIAWPDKPVNTAAADFQRKFISDRVVYSTTPTIYGWSYMDLGAGGVVVVLFCLGVIARLVEAYLAKNQRGKLAAVIFYTALFVTLAEIEADPFWLLAGIPKILIFAMLVYGVIAVFSTRWERSLRA